MARSRPGHASPAARGAQFAPSGSGSAQATVNVGQRLRELRGRQRLSLRALAERSGLNANTLSLIENEKSSPSVATLQQAAAALGVPISAFFETSADTQPVVFHPAGAPAGLPFGRGQMHDLGAGMVRRGIEPLLLVLEPQGGSGRTPIVHTGREFVYCLEGRLAYSIDGQTYVLGPGDSLLFEAYLPHRWHNAGDTPSRSLLVLCPADERDQPAARHFPGASGGR
jgi:transcriptional regulator with XRE-family HTH domain